jgi:hypothetical protein
MGFSPAEVGRLHCIRLQRFVAPVRRLLLPADSQGLEPQKIC